MQPSTGHTVTHCGESNAPSHSEHSSALITKIESPAAIAVLGHSGSRAALPGFRQRPKRA
jgi:hypothetical protein